MKINNKKRMLWEIIFLIFLIINISLSVSVEFFIKEPINIIDGFFKLEKVVNPGLAFGINNNNKSNFVITLIVLFVVFNFIKNQKERMDKKTQIAIGLVLAGGIGNLIDRLFFGGVLDYISIMDFPIFNFADILIIVGWIILCVSVIKFATKPLPEDRARKEKLNKELNELIEKEKKSDKTKDE